jgi:predicted Zn-dependent protease
MLAEKLEPPDSHYLNAAKGWLGLRDWLSANQELNAIRAEYCAHPEVLRVRVLVYESAGQWAAAAEVARALARLDPGSPFGWVHWAHALAELRRVQEAWDALRPMANTYPEEYRTYQRLSTYASQLGNLVEALRWLQKAINLANAQRSRGETQKQAPPDTWAEP